MCVWVYFSSIRHMPIRWTNRILGFENVNVRIKLCSLIKGVCRSSDDRLVVSTAKGTVTVMIMEKERLASRTTRRASNRGLHSSGIQRRITGLSVPDSSRQRWNLIFKGQNRRLFWSLNTRSLRCIETSWSDYPMTRRIPEVWNPTLQHREDPPLG